MENRYAIQDTDPLLSPSLVVFREVMEANLDEMIRIAGSIDRLRPHCKTHKMPAVAALQVARGIRKHKAATFAEAEMLADAGADDILLAYNVVGPNVARAVAFRKRFPSVRFAVTADHPRPVERLGAAMAGAGETIAVMLDLDVGLHRTGVDLVTDAEEARRLYHAIGATEGLETGGFHVYDGHNHQRTFDERRVAVETDFEPVLKLRGALNGDGQSVPCIVAGGTGSFPVYAAMGDATVEVSPGTCIFHDAGYGERFDDLAFVPAALLLTRVVSRPTPDRITLDLGYKAISADQPEGTRMHFAELPDAVQVLQNEEHLVLQTPEASRFEPGDVLLAIPRHICPSTALHRQVYVVSDGRLASCWDVTARDRVVTV